MQLDDYTPITTAYFGSCTGTAACTGGATGTVGNASINANDQLQYAAVLGGASVGAGAAGAAVLVSTVAANTSAYIGEQSSLTIAQTLTLASDFTDTYDSAILSGTAGLLALNAPVATITDDSNNSAYVADNASITAGGALSVTATTTRTIAALAASAAVGAVAGGGSVLTVTFGGATNAYLGNSDTEDQISAASLQLRAALNDTLPALLPAAGFAPWLAQLPGIGQFPVAPTGALGGASGLLSGDGAVVVVTEGGLNQAYADGSTVNTTGGMDIDADTTLNLDALSGSQDAGLLAGGASVATLNSQGQTIASSSGTLTSANGGVTLDSQSNENLTATAIGLGTGVATGGAAVSTLNDTSINHTNQTGTITAAAGAALVADSELDFNALTGEVSLGGVAGGASVATLNSQDNTAVSNGGTLISSNGAVALDGTINESLTALGVGMGAGVIGGSASVGSITDTSSNSTSQTGTINANGGISLLANTVRNSQALTGSASGGFLAVGASVATLANGGATSVTSSDTLTSGGGLVRLDSESKQILTAAALSLGGGIVDGGAAVSTLNDTSSNTTTQSGAITGAGGISVLANTSRNLQTLSGAAHAGALAGGESIATTNSSGSTAVTSSGSLTSSSGAVGVEGESNEVLGASAGGLGAGLVSGGGAASSVNSSSTNTTIQGGTISAGNGASVLANTIRQATSTAGVAEAGVVSLGASVANLNLGGSTASSLNGSVTSTGGAIALTASSNDTGTADATVLAGGVSSGAGALLGNDSIDPAVAATLPQGASAAAPTVNENASDTSNLMGTVDGVQVGAVNVGVLAGAVTVAPTTTLDMNGTITGGSADLEATGSESASMTSTASQSPSLADGYAVDATANVTPAQSLNLGGSINVANAATIASTLTDAVNATSSTPGSAFSVAAGGTSFADATINDSNLVTASGSVTVANGGADLSALTTNQANQDPANPGATGGNGSAVAVLSVLQDNTSVTDTTGLELSGSVTTLQGTATLLAQAIEEATSQASETTSGSSITGFDTLESDATTTVTGAPTVTLDPTASVRAQELNLQALMPTVQGAAITDTLAQRAADGNATSNSSLTMTAAPTINVNSNASGGANLDAGAINMLAGVGNPDKSDLSDASANATATSGTNSVDGESIASTSNTFNIKPTVNTGAGVAMTTGALNIQALNPGSVNFINDPIVSGVSTVTWVENQVQTIVDETFGWIPFIGPLIKQIVQWTTTWTEKLNGSSSSATSLGGINYGTAINLNGTIQKVAGTGGASLVIGPDGAVQPGGNGIAIAGQDANTILLGNIVNDNPLQITLDATNGTVSGSPTINELTMLPYVDITNNSNLNLVVQQIAPVEPSGTTPPIALTATTDNFTPNFIGGQTPTPITIDNTGSGNVVFTAPINDEPGSLVVANIGGDILDAQGNLLQLNQTALDARHGSIGSANGATLSCALCPGAVNGSLTLGAVDLQPDEVAATPTAEPLIPTVSAVARGDINLTLTPFESSQGVSVNATPEVDIGQILAGGDINLTLNPANIQGPGSSSVNSPAANTNYALDGGWIVAGGAVGVQANGGANQVTLTDNGLVASGFESLDLYFTDLKGLVSSNIVMPDQNNETRINYLQTLAGPLVLSDITGAGAGQLNFSGQGVIAGTGTLGALAGYSDISISGAPLEVQNILDPQGAGSIAIGSGFTVASTLTQTLYGASSGLINIENIGDVTLAGSIVVPGGTINIAAQGGISNAGAGLDLSADNITLNADGGAVGSASSHLTGSASGQWNVSAGGGIFLTSSGAFNAGTLAAPGSNVQLTVNGGNATIANLSANDASLALTQPGASLDVDAATISGVLMANADVMDFNQITNPNATNPLFLSLKGAGGGMAQTIDAVIASSAPVIAETYESQTGSIDVEGDWFLLERSIVGQSATFANNWESLAVANSTGRPELIAADFVGSTAKALAPELAITATDLKPGLAFTRPATLSPAEQMLVNLLNRLP